MSSAKETIQEATLISSEPDMLTDGPTSRRVIAELLALIEDSAVAAHRLLEISKAIEEPTRSLKSNYWNQRDAKIAEQANSNFAHIFMQNLEPFAIFYGTREAARAKLIDIVASDPDYFYNTTVRYNVRDCA